MLGNKTHIIGIIIFLFCCTSCISIDDDWQEVITQATVRKSVNIHSDVDVNVVLNDKQKSGTNVVFEIDDEDLNEVTLLVTKPGYVSQSVKVGFNYLNTVGLDIHLVKEPAIEISQEDAISGTPIVNDQANQNQTDVKATVLLPEKTLVYGENTSYFSVSVSTPSMAIDRELKPQDIIKVPIYSIALYPQSVRFSKPASVCLEIEQSNDYELEIVNNGGVVPSQTKGNTITSEMDVFSDCTIYMTAEVVKTEKGVEEITGSLNAYKVDDNTISYQGKTGYENCSSDSRIVNCFFNNVFGTPFITLSKKAVFKSSINRVDYTIIQPYCDYTFKSGETTFVVRAYAPDSVIVKQVVIDKEDFKYGGSSGESSGL